MSKRLMLLNRSSESEYYCALASRPESGHGLDMSGLHFPRLKKLPAVALAALMFFVSLSPEQAIENVRNTFTFFGGTAPTWFTPAILGAFGRQALFFGALPLLVWALWPGRSNGPIESPRRNWRPISAAPFELAPLSNYAMFAHAWREPILSGVLPGSEEPDGRRMTFKGEVPKAACRDKNGLDFTCRYDWKRRGILLLWSNPRGESWSAFCGHKDLQNPVAPEHLDKATWDLIRLRCLEAWEYVLFRGLNLLVAAGHLRVWGRHGSLSAPFTEIKPDAWSHYGLTDVEKGTATSGQDLIYSVHIEARPVWFAALIQRVSEATRRKPGIPTIPAEHVLGHSLRRRTDNDGAASAPTAGQNTPIATPGVMLTTEPGRFVFHNAGTVPFYIVGSRFGTGPSSVSEPRLVLPGFHYWIPTGPQEEELRVACKATTGAVSVPLEMFLLGGDGQTKFAADFKIIAELSGSGVATRGQTLGVNRRDW